MFDSFEFRLERPLKKNEIPAFNSQFLKEVKAHKLMIDPVGRQVGTVFYLNQSDAELRDMVHAFLNKWQRGDEKKERLQANPSKDSANDRRDGHDAWLEHLQSCCNPGNHENISDQLLENQWIVLLKGQEIGYSKEIMHLLDVFDRSFLEYFNERIHEMEERQYSAFIPKYYLEKMGYFESAPTHLFFASHLQHDTLRIEQFAQDVRHHNGKLPGHAGEYLDKPEYILQSAPCFKVYFELENSQLHSNKVFCLRGLSFRNELKNTFLLERLLNFSMREYVFVGSPDFVMEYRNKSLEWTMEWMRKLGLKGHCERANDPFFITDESREQFDIPRNVKYEIRADIPYKQESISIASFDTHGDYFSAIFNISMKETAAVWSGCIGLGLERCVWSFLQQYGLDKEQWPEAVLHHL